MILWASLALMTGAAVMAVLWPLSAIAAPAEDPSDVSFYRDQLRDVERDVARDLLGPAEAHAARIEAGRRLLRASAAERRDLPVLAEPALRRRRAAAALALSIVPLAGLALYGALGSPNLAAGRGTTVATADLEISDALGRIEEHLAVHPEDGRGWEVVAPVYMKLGRFSDAAKAYEASLRLGGESSERLVSYGESLVAAESGIVTAPARQAFQRATVLDPGSAKGAFYLAVAAEQDGDATDARARLRTLLDGSDPRSPWRPVVESHLAKLDAPSGPVVQTLPAASVTPDIAAMVAGLDARLKEAGGTEEEWTRLIRSYVVLNRRDQARDALLRAKVALRNEKASAERLQHAAERLGLSSEEARR